MKKLNYLLLGMAGLALSACSNEDVQAPVANGDGNVQITVSLPTELGTRADAALSSGTAATSMSYAVYETNGDTNTLLYTKDEETFFASGLTNTLTLNLLTGKSYTVAFFAYAPGTVTFLDETTTESTTAYAVNWSENTIAANYGNMTEVTDASGNNVDTYDCFLTVWSTGEITGPLSDNIELKRPVAQLNWGSDDLESPLVEQAYGEAGANIYTTLTAEEIPNEINFMTGAVTGSETGEYTFPVYPIVKGATFPVGTTYSYVASQYILAGTATTTIDATLLIANNETSGSATESHEVEVPNVPLQANYQTNIYGSLLTNAANLTISVYPGFTSSNDVDIDGAKVEITEQGTVNCITPKLPTGVTEDDIEGHAAVAIDEDGNPVYFENTGASINEALQKYSEIYFAPNTTITTGAHTMRIPQSGVTIHGNGATIKGGENDFALPTPNVYNDEYANGSTVDITISNLNGMEIWGGPTGDYTININLTNCTYTGTGRAGKGSLIMASGADEAETTINFNLQNCYATNTQVSFFSTYPGTSVINNCKFDGVGIPINAAKKFPGKKSNITVSNCTFNNCGITPNSSDNAAWNYAAPVRVVDNGGPSYYTTLLIENCEFEDNLSKYDILLWDYRTDKVRKSYPVKLTVVNCEPENPTIYTIKEPVTMGPGPDYPDPEEVGVEIN